MKKRAVFVSSRTLKITERETVVTPRGAADQLQLFEDLSPRREAFEAIGVERIGGVRCAQNVAKPNGAFGRRRVAVCVMATARHRLGPQRIGERLP